MNKEKFMLYYSFTITFLLVLIFFIGGTVWADSNGVWHRAEDIQGGIFGSDEQLVTSGLGFRFINRVVFSDEIYFNSILNCDGKLYTDISGKIFCGIDNVNDSDNIIGNEYPLAGNGIILGIDNRTININTTQIATRAYVDSSLALPTCIAGSTLIADSSGNWICKIPPGSVEFITPGANNFVVPNGVTSITIDAVGGGGGGGGGGRDNTANCNYQMLGSGGGGASGAVSSTIISVTAGQVLTINVGSGGLAGLGRSSTGAGTNGGSGQLSTVIKSGSTILSASGGNGGIGGNGLVCAGWDANYGLGGSGVGSGGYGGYGGTGPSGCGPSRSSSNGNGPNPGFGGSGSSCPYNGGGGGGGGNLFGQGGNGGAAGTIGSNGIKGGGGGGGGAIRGSTSQNGGSGGSGYVKISWS